jgi:hypothetical protein
MHNLTSNSIRSFQYIIEIAHQAPGSLLLMVKVLQLFPQFPSMCKLIQSVYSSKPVQEPTINVINSTVDHLCIATHKSNIYHIIIPKQPDSTILMIDVIVYVFAFKPQFVPDAISLSAFNSSFNKDRNCRPKA